MIIWSGLGFLPIIFLMVFGFGFASENDGAMSDKALACIFFLTGLASGALGWWLRTRPARVLVDKATGQEVVLRRRHSLFFVPMFYWGPIFFAMAIYELIQAATKH
jgi:hypothetical protein